MRFFAIIALLFMPDIATASDPRGLLVFVTAPVSAIAIAASIVIVNFSKSNYGYLGIFIFLVISFSVSYVTLDFYSCSKYTKVCSIQVFLFLMLAIPVWQLRVKLKNLQ